VIAVVAAVGQHAGGRGLVIGRDGGLPWRVPEDLQRFKRLTMGHHVLVGRRTYDTLPAPLAGRRVWVATRNLAWRPRVGTLKDLCGRVSDLDGFLRRRYWDGIDLWVAGGADVYGLALLYAERIELTVVAGTYEGDTFFPGLTCAGDIEGDDVTEHGWRVRDARTSVRPGAPACTFYSLVTAPPEAPRVTPTVAVPAAFLAAVQ
jgi:dihydrofolate reductase